VLTANDGTAGGYEAVFSNSFGMATTAVAVLTVIDPPVIATSPVSQTANAGASVTFTASITGGPAGVQWYLINYLGTNAVAGAASPALTVTAGGPTAGSYFAVFSNGAGSATTSAANLGVLNLPFVNGSFEINTNGAVFAAGSTTLINVGATWMEGWTVGGPGNDVYVLDGLVDGLSPYQGQQYMNFHAYGNPAGGTLAQTFTTTVGQTYVVTFEVGELGTGVQSLTAKAFASSGALLASNYCVPVSVEWTQFQLDFAAVSTNTTLFFLDSSTMTATANVTLDAVVVNSASSTGAPVVIQSPANQTVPSGTQVSFSALAGGSPSAIQWFLTNSVGVNPVAGATSSPLVLTANDGTAGGYEAVFSNSFGMATTAVAVLTVIDPPVIATSPASQTANAGASVTFTASMTGGPAGVQWYLINYLGTNAVAGAASPSLTVTAGGPTAGSYFAVFSNGAGSATTSAANLAVLGLPLVNGSFEIITNHAAIPANGQSSAVVNLGDTWLTGWTPGGPGGDIFVVNGPGYGGPYELSPYDGKQWIDFNGNNTQPGGTLSQTITTTVGQTYTVAFEVGEYGSGPQSLTALAFGSNNVVIASNYCVPASDEWTQFQLEFAAVSTNTTLFFKDSSTITVGADLALDAVTALSAPVVVTSPASQTVTNGSSVTFTASASGSPATVQWFQGTNLIPGATNTTLTFVANAASGGNYTAVFTNPAGSATTAPALLTVDNPVFFTRQPQSLVTNLGANVTLAGAVGGDAPIVFQWEFDGASIAGATNANLVLSNVQPANAGSYVLLATNASGWAASTDAVLSIVSTLQVVSANVAGAGTVTVPVDLIATGNESVLTFSLDFDPTVLTFVGIAAGSGAPGASFTWNTNPAVGGQIGLLAAYIGTTFPPGTHEIADVTFAAVLATNSVTTTIGFGGSPTPEKIIDAGFDQLPGAFLAGTVTVAPASLEGDVWPRPNGNDVIDANDWQQEARFVVGLDTITNTSEFQRADCAPRSTGGDGVIDALDLVQVGRYVVGLDPLTPVGAPAGPAPERRAAKSKTIHPLDSTNNRTISLVPMPNVANAVMVQLLAEGDEGALVFSVSFDPAILSLASATPGAGTSGAMFMANSTAAATGKLAIALALPSGKSFAAGTNQIAELAFNLVNYSNLSALAFTNSPALCSVSDVTGSTHLSATYQNAVLAVWPALDIASTGRQVTLSWPSSATNFVVQMTTNFSAAWTAAGGAPVSNGSAISLTLPAPATTTYYRLSQP
jgi:hypothetical protein